MKDYTTMTDSELDKLAAERFFKIEEMTYSGEIFRLSESAVIDYDYAYTQQQPKQEVVAEGKRLISRLANWNPTHPESNQIQRYIFPKLRDRGLIVSLTFYTTSNFTYISIHGGDVDVKGETKDPDQINRTIAIACLEAWDNLGDQDERN